MGKTRGYFFLHKIIGYKYFPFSRIDHQILFNMPQLHLILVALLATGSIANNINNNDDINDIDNIINIINNDNEDNEDNNSNNDGIIIDEGNTISSNDTLHRTRRNTRVVICTTGYINQLLSSYSRCVYLTAREANAGTNSATSRRYKTQNNTTTN